MALSSWKTLENLAKRYGLPTPKTIFVSSENAAKKAAKDIKYPLALKIFSERGLHKTKIGGVVCDINDEKELVNAYNRISSNLKKTGTKSEGFLVQEMVTGLEVMIGMKQSSFGPAIAFGLGGIFVETLKDFSLRIAPVDRKQAEDMIKEVRTYSILKSKKCNINSIINLITKISKLSINNKDIKEIDLNPVIVNNKGAKVVDIRIIK